MTPPSIAHVEECLEAHANVASHLEKKITSFHDRVKVHARAAPLKHTAEERKLEKEEDILSSVHDEKFLTFPVKYQSVCALWQKMVGSSWTVDEIPFHDDRDSWKELPLREKMIIIKILVFFLHGDHALAVASAEELGQRVTPFELKAFYAHQSANEMLHVQTYSQHIVTLINWCTPEERGEIDKCLDALNSPATTKKIEWAMRWSSQNGALFSELLVAYGAVEGVMFAASFMLIFYYKTRGVLPGLQTSNRLISTDEGIHTDNGWTVYNLLKTRLSSNVVREMIGEAVDAEIAFVNEILDEPLHGLNKEDAADYVKHIADRLLGCFGEKPVYGVENPLDFMNVIGLPIGTNFLEKRSSEYVMISHATPDRLEDVDDF